MAKEFCEKKGIFYNKDGFKINPFEKEKKKNKNIAILILYVYVFYVD